MKEKEDINEVADYLLRYWNTGNHSLVEHMSSITREQARQILYGRGRNRPMWERFSKDLQYSLEHWYVFGTFPVISTAQQKE